MKIKFVLTVLVFLYGKLFCVAQNPEQFLSVESPNSASLKGKVESPVTLNTGKAGISIPIYSIKDKSIEVPIVLSHRSGGVKPDLHPGWLGTNWSLMAGGSITRNVKGIPDEMYWRNDYVLTIAGDNTGSYTLPFGYCYNYPVNSTSSWNTSQQIADLAKNGMEPNTFWFEAEPDEYIFECGGYSGKFYIDHNGNIRVQGNPDIKIEPDVVYNVPLFDDTKSFDQYDNSTFTSVNLAFYDLSSNPIYSYNRIYKAILMGFKVTTPDGMQYEFGMYGKDYDDAGTMDEVEFTSEMFGQFLLDEIFTTWHLVKITAPTGDTVSLTYERGAPIIQLGQSFSFYKSGGTAPAKGFLGFLFGGPSAYTSEAKLEAQGNFIRPTYLKKITSKDAVVEFITSASTEQQYNYEGIVWELLFRSQYYDPNYASPYYARLMIGDIFVNPNMYSYPPGIWDNGNNHYTLFRYDGLIEELYFNELQWMKLDTIRVRARNNEAVIGEWAFNYTNSSSERLQLLSLQESGKNGMSMPAYTFEYDDSQTLPGYNSFKVDHWGYYNNSNSLATIDIDDEQTLIDYKDYREPNATYAYAGSLSKVTTPLGGYKLFEYEPNSYKSVVKRNTSTGAFSVDNLSAAKTGGGLRIKKITDNDGTGNPDIIKNYTYGDGLLLGDIQYYWPDYKGLLLNGNEYASQRFVTQSLLPISENPGGGEIIYDDVTETTNSNGKIVYKYNGFSSHEDQAGVSIDAQKTPYSPFTSKGLERGLIKEKYVYDNQDRLLTSDVYEYTANPGFSDDYIRTVHSRGMTLFGGTETNVIEGTAYKHYLYPYQNVTRTSKVYDVAAETYAVTEQDFTYNTNAVPYNDNQLKELSTTNSKSETLIQKFKHPMDFPSNTVYQGMVSNHILNVPVEQTEWKGTTQLTKSTTSYYNPSTGIYVPEYVEEKKSNAASEIRTRFHTYDTKGNLLSVSKENDSRTSYVWETNGNRPLAKVINAEYEEVIYAPYNNLLEDPVDKISSPSGVSLASVPDGPMGNVALDMEDQLGIMELLVELEASKTYVLTYWEKGCELELDRSGGVLNILSSNIVRTKGDWNLRKVRFTNGGDDLMFLFEPEGFIQELRLYPEDAMMETYTYDPLVGMTSMCDANNRITYYEYDDMGRLALVKDEEGNILKQICYNYQGQVTDCNIPVVYVKATYENIQGAVVSGAYNEVADVYIRFYDADGQPFALTDDLTIYASEDTWYNGIFSYSNPFEPGGLIGNTYILIASQALIRMYTLDENGNKGELTAERILKILVNKNYIIHPDTM